MSGNLTIFESAISALGANSQALSVAGQNVANVNTPGYSRQQVVMASATPQTVGGVELGLGVNIASVNRVYDQFIEKRVTDATTSSGNAQTQYDQLQPVEQAFNELSSDGLSKYMTDFFNSWHEVAGAPDSIPARQAVLGKAGIMVDRIHSLDTTLRTTRTNIDGDIKNIVDKINALSTDIASLSQKIKVSSSGEALTFNDQRQQKVKDLSQYINTTAFESADGVFQVYIGDGLQLINGANRAVLGTAADVTNSNLSNVTFSSNGSTSTNVTSRLSQGQLAGDLAIRDTTVVSYQTRLNELAYQMANQVNTVHLASYNLSSATGKYFFGNLASTTDAAQNIAISSDVDGIPSAIAASDSLSSVPGGNAGALTLAGLQSANIVFTTGTNTFQGFHSDLLAKVGNDTQSANNDAVFSKSVLDQAAAYREQVSGVSVDEEQLNIVKYQAAFQAAAKLVSVSREILDTLVHLGE